MKRGTFRRVLKIGSSFLSFFLMIGFAVSCCMMLFLSVFAETMNITFTHDNITSAAKLTFANVLVISIISLTIDIIRRRIMVGRPVKKITEATERIMQGDFSVKIKHVRGANSEGFNQIADAINSLTCELSGIETLRTDFVSNVSHEMKTPLAVMQNYGTLLQSPGLSEEKRMEYAKGVTDASRRLAEMMTNILKLSRLENQQIFPQTTKFDLGEQLCECLLQFENVWEQKDIEIETDIAEDVILEADEELLSLVWNNLLSNAFKFTEAGGTVSVKLTATEHHAVVSISDNGCGMSADVGKHIFEKFYQGDTSRATQGNGLGLALVKRVIDITHGEIMVESAVGVGTTFTVKIRRS